MNNFSSLFFVSSRKIVILKIDVRKGLLLIKNI